MSSIVRPRFNPRTLAYHYSDFFGDIFVPSPATVPSCILDNLRVNYNAGGGLSVVQNPPTNGTHPGVAKIQFDDAVTTYYELCPSSGDCFSNWAGHALSLLLCCKRISNVANLDYWSFGGGRLIGGSYFIGFAIEAGAVNLECVTRDPAGNQITYLPLPGTVDFTDFEIKITPALVLFYVNSSLVASHTNHIAVDTLPVVIRHGGTGSGIAQVGEYDFFYLESVQAR